MPKSQKNDNDVLFVVIPAYNEEETILSVIDDWYPIVEKYNGNKKSRLVILNDGSKDNTAKLIKQAKKTHPLLELVDKKNSGHGATVLEGYHYALDHGADYIFQTDSDGQTRPSEFHDFWKLRKDYDMLIGHRNHRKDGFSRVVVTRTLRAVVKLLFGEYITDANAPFRLMSRETLEENLKLIPKDYNLSNVVLSVIYTKKQQRVKFIPITFRPRQGGVNSINLKRIFGIGWGALKDFPKINKSLASISKKGSDPKIYKILTALFLILLSVVVSFSFSDNPVGPFYEQWVDTNVFKYIGQSMIDGEVPYRDTFDHKGPLLYFINVLGLSISNVYGIWLIEVITLFISILLIYKICKKFTTRVPALIVTSLVTSMIFTYSSSGNKTEQYALPFILASLSVFLDFFINPRSFMTIPKDEKPVIRSIKRITDISALNKKWFDFRVAFCGICCAAVLFLRPNMIAVWVVFPIMIFAYCVAHKRYQEIWKYIISFIAGVAIVSLPILAYLAINGAFNDFIYDYFIFNFVYTKESATTLLGRLKAICHFAKITVVLAALLITVVNLYVSRKDKSNFLFNLGWLAFICLSVVLVGMASRTNGVYALAIVPAVLYPLCLVCDTSITKFKEAKLSQLAPLCLMVVIGFDAGFDAVKAAGKVFIKPYENNIYASHLEYIEKYSSKDDKIAVVGNADVIYNYSGRKSALKYSYVRPIICMDDKLRDEFETELNDKVPKIIFLMYSKSECDVPQRIVESFIEKHPEYSMEKIYSQTANTSDEITENTKYDVVYYRD